MTPSAISRRSFIKDLTLSAAILCAGSRLAPAADAKPALHIASNQYPWGTFYRRQNRNFDANLDAGLADVAAAGLNGFEPILGSPQQAEQVATTCRKHNLEMRSFYVNSTLHTPDDASRSIPHILAIASKAKEFGARIVVTNPNPIRWGGPENKTDAMLKTQAAALNELGQKLADLGMVLSYHNHDIELRNAAREFHHMMCGTDPKFVTLCLDAHWIYRGSGNSAVAVFDVLKLYGPRISELHLRQSAKDIWTESFGQGDIDYLALAKQLAAINLKPHLVMEQAVEAGSPNTVNGLEAHRKSTEYARQIFAGFAA